MFMNMIVFAFAIAFVTVVMSPVAWMLQGVRLLVRDMVSRR
jgi:hypothetical protein